MGSAICLPVSLTGFSAFIAPWKMMLISLQRILLMPNSVRLARFLPSKRTSPLTMRPFSGSSLSRLSAAVVLPQPDSPARPRLSPGLSTKLTSCTALTSPTPSLKNVVSPRTSSSPSCSIRSIVFFSEAGFSLVAVLASGASPAPRSTA